MTSIPLSGRRCKYNGKKYALREEKKRKEITNMYGDQKEKGGAGKQMPKLIPL